MTIFIGSDHAGYTRKEKIKKYFDNKGIKYEDIGTNSKEPVDYPEYAQKAGKKVANKRGSKGILVCGSGTGMAMAANKVKGVRAAAAYDIYSARMSRVDNDANVLCLRGRRFGFNKTKKIIDAWLNTKFGNVSRHKKRIKKMMAIR